MTKITIIGGGASGILLAANLLKNAGEQRLTINLIEKNADFGGVAYGMAKDFHLLNVPAVKMGAFPDQVDGFYNWLQVHKYDFLPTDFVPRRIYGKYLEQIFGQAIDEKNDNTDFQIIKDEAIDVVSENGETVVSLKSGDSLPTDKVVLAFGNFLPPHLRTADLSYTKSEKYFQNPWSAEIPQKISVADDVLIIGTGLTGVDVLSSFHQNGHRGKIFALSTHGWFPAVHAQTDVYPSFQIEIEAINTARGLLKIVHRHLKNAETDGNNWRAVIDAMRSFTPETWNRLPLIEKRRFMRHLQRRWDVSRHRMPPQCQQILQKLESANQLQTLRGKIRAIELREDGKFEITFGQENKVVVDWVINCTGSQSNFAKLDAPLVKNLLTRGEIQPDPLRMGLAATADGEIIAEDGKISAVLTTFGTALKGILWETTAMPEIRTQAANLAFKLLKKEQGQTLPVAVKN